MPLSDAQIRKAKPLAKPQKLFDGDGLFMLITPAGGKLWRFKYRVGGTEKLLALGAYPEVSLADARTRREEARKILAQGIDPSEVKRAAKIKARVQGAETFGAVADEWLVKRCATLAKVTVKKKESLLKNHLRPWLDSRPVREISAPELLAVLRRVESSGANELAHKALHLFGQIMRYAVQTGRAERNPAGDLRGALEPVVVKHHAAITEPKKIGELLRALGGYEGHFVVACALRLAPLVFVRPGELRAARWADIDLDGAEWRYLVTKTKTDHIVPLSTQALSILRELHPLTGHGNFVFPSLRTGDRPMSENTINAALRRLGFGGDEMVGHGFRAMARTSLDEVLGFRPDFIEHQLAHAVRDPNGRAYNRTAHLAERKKMMQAWADYLDQLKAGAVVVPLHGNVA